MPRPLPSQPVDLSAVVEALAEAGLDLVRPFDAAAYNALTRDHPRIRPLHLFGRGGAQAMVIANTRRLWSPFVESYGRRPELRVSTHPVDDYVTAAIRSCARALKVDHRLYLAHEAGEGRVSMLHAAEASGLATVGPAHLAVHREHGPWIGLRAVLVLDAPPGVRDPDRGSAPCEGCPAPCREALANALADSEGVPRGQAEIAAGWRRWVAVRDACPVGRASRYPEDQLRYHYTKDRAALGVGALPDEGA